MEKTVREFMLSKDGFIELKFPRGAQFIIDTNMGLRLFSEEILDAKAKVINSEFSTYDVRSSILVIVDEWDLIAEEREKRGL